MKSFSNIPFHYWFALMPGLLLFFVSARPISLQEKYIEQFKDLAISEMERTGIPASIKMAQALLESQSGQSELALNANNHFGIKCKNEWTGGIYFYHDDDKNEEGNIIASCFRSYSTACDSYKDHSDFLINRSRYKELFSLSKTDYVAWAQGLKRCGYATDPIYSERLIKIIQKFNLENLDVPKNLPESNGNVVNESYVEMRIDHPVDPIISKPITMFVSKNIPKNITIISHKTLQKHKRKRRK